MIEEGKRVRVVGSEHSPTSLKKHAGEEGIVTMMTPSVNGPLLYVHMDGNPAGVESSFREEDLEEAQEEWEQAY